MARAVEQPRRAGIRAADLRGVGELIRFVAGHPPIVVVAAAVLGAAATRLAIGGLGPVDALTAVVILALVGPVEWAVHRYLFHAPQRSFRQRKLRFGAGHRRHHRDPDDLHWLLLSPGGMTAFAAALVLVAAVVGTVTATGFGAAPTGPIVTGAALTLAALVNYELSHLVFHTRVQPRSRRLRRLRANHLAHHHREPNARFGVSTTLGDRLFGPRVP